MSAPDPDACAAPKGLETQGNPPMTCAWCGTAAEGAAALLTWTSSVEGSGAAAVTRYYCPACSRENARAIEGRLDAAWW